MRLPKRNAIAIICSHRMQKLTISETRLGVEAKVAQISLFRFQNGPKETYGKSWYLFPHIALVRGGGCRRTKEFVGRRIEAAMS